MTDRDLSRLLPSQWLNDEIINFYGQMILSRSNTAQKKKGLSMGANGVNGVNGVNGFSKGCATRGKLGSMILDVHYFSTFFWSKLKGDGYEKGRLAKWTKKVSTACCQPVPFAGVCLTRDMYAHCLPSSTYFRRTCSLSPSTTTTPTGPARR